MFPHDKLDWTLSRLQRQVTATPDDAQLRLRYARASISKGQFHGGGDEWFNEAVHHARRALHHAPGDAEALVLGGLALAFLDRPEPAERFLHDARASVEATPEYHIALGVLRREKGDRTAALHEFEAACRLAPRSWEAHMMLGRTLAEHARRRPRARLVERAQFHLVRALELKPSPQLRPQLIEQLGMLCLDTRRVEDAQRLFEQLLDHEANQGTARYHLGRVAFLLGKYKKAIVYFRQYLDEHDGDSLDAWTRIAAAYLQLREPARAREACGRALAKEPTDLEARWILGSALIADGERDDAVRLFRELLEMAPDHTDAYAELVRLRARDQDVRWLRQALRSETALYDRLPASAHRVDGRSGRTLEMNPRDITCRRIEILVNALGHVDRDVERTVLACLDLTTDEGLRFRLWDLVLDTVAKRGAHTLRPQLTDPGRHFSVSLGHYTLAVAEHLTESELIDALAIEEEDLRRAAVERNGPTDDVAVHREQIAIQRAEARAWQAALLLAIGTHSDTAGRNLLVRWASDADDDLALAARTALALHGDDAARDSVARTLEDRGFAAESGRFREVTSAADRTRLPMVVTDRSDLVCATCGRNGSSVAHMLLRADTAVCSECLTTIAQKRHELAVQDPSVTCALTGASLLDVDAIYVYQELPISSACVDVSLGYHEREAVARFLATL